MNIMSGKLIKLRFVVFQENYIILTEPVPQPLKHEGMIWYLPNVCRSRAEALLRRVPHEGAFLVRPCENDKNQFAISFR